jgi:hypothetical protein
MRKQRNLLGVLLGSLIGAGCGSGSSPASPGSAEAGSGDDGGPALGDGGVDSRDSGGSHPPSADGGDDASTAADTGASVASDASYAYDDGSVVLRADRFVTSVVSFSPTECTGFGQSAMPGIVEGPPVGGGSQEGSTDVVSLGSGGSIVVGFAPNAIVDGPGPDFIVFENPFWIGGDSSDPYAEPGQVSVSDDGVTWTAFPCAPTVDPQATDGTGVAAPYPATCGGWQVVDSNPDNGISPVDPGVAGGLALDLATVGVTHARYVKIVDQTHEACPEAGAGPTTNGFDLDAVGIVNAELP